MRHTRIRVPVMQELFGRVDLAPVPVRNKAHEILKRCIIEGKLAPGQRLIIILEASRQPDMREPLASPPGPDQS